MPPENVSDEVIVDLPSDVVALATDGSPPVDDKPIQTIRLRSDPDSDPKIAETLQKRIEAAEREREEARTAADESARRAATAEAAARAAAEARQRAEETASVRTEQAMRAHWAKVNADHQQIVGAIDAAKERELSARQAYIAAREAGDAAKEADALAQMTGAQTAIAQLETGRIAAEDQIGQTKRLFEQHAAEVSTPRQEPKPEPKPEPRAPTPDEWIDSARSVLGESAAWLKEHKEIVTDAKLNRKFLRFCDDYADDHGQSALKSAEFRKALSEKFFPDEARMENDRNPGNREDVEVEKPRARTPVSAPVSRAGNVFSSRNLDAAQVRLPPKLAAFVKSSGLDPTKYAIQAVAEIKAGRLPKNFLDPDYDHTV